MQERVTEASGYEFLWSRDRNERRLLQYHIDRSTYPQAVRACTAANHSAALPRHHAHVQLGI